MKPAGNWNYSFVSPVFGRLNLHDNCTRARALEIRRRYHGAGSLEASQKYRYCERCESRPCVCPPTAPAGGDE